MKKKPLILICCLVVCFLIACLLTTCHWQDKDDTKLPKQTAITQTNLTDETDASDKTDTNDEQDTTEDKTDEVYTILSEGDESCEHSYAVASGSPTCVTPGYKKYTCKHCGYSYRKEEVAALGHVLEGDTNLKLPTLTKDGSQTGVCSRCSKNINESIDAYNKHLDYIIDVPANRQPVILQISDTQIIDSAQQRYPGRLGGTTSYQYLQWMTDKTEENYKIYLRQVIERVKPDLILLVGDIVYGEFDDSGTAFTDIVRFFDSFNIPWAPVFGNHENESAKGVDWQCDQLESARNCLFVQRELTGNGNYTVGITQGGQLTRVFYMLDSNGCGGATVINDHYKKTSGFGEDQIQWYSRSMRDVRTTYGNGVNLSMVFHIQIQAFYDAYKMLGYVPKGTLDSGVIDLGNKTLGSDTDFGVLGTLDTSLTWDLDGKVWNTILKLGVDSVFVGHEHANSFSVTYEGVRLQFGQKSSTYDKTNYRLSDGTILASSNIKAGTPIVGGTVIPLSADGEIRNPYLALYE